METSPRRDRRSSTLSRIGAGAVVGALVLGVLGRVATSIVARTAGDPTHLTAVGLLEAAWIGALIGAVVGLAAGPIRRAFPGSSLRVGARIGAIAFVLTLVPAWLVGIVPLSGPRARADTIIVVLAVYLAFGMVLAEVEHRLGLRDDAKPEPT